jgi:hypothetical protein
LFIIAIITAFVTGVKCGKNIENNDWLYIKFYLYYWRINK